jgi:hypothetical protein
MYKALYVAADLYVRTRQRQLQGRCSGKFVDHCPPVRSPLGRDGANRVTRMDPAPGLGRPGRAEAVSIMGVWNRPEADIR